MIQFFGRGRRPHELTVTIEDRPGNPAHIHGPLDLWGFVTNTTVIVKVTVVPIKDAFHYL
jgi:hypothetical protein